MVVLGNDLLEHLIHSGPKTSFPNEPGCRYDLLEYTKNSFDRDFLEFNVAVGELETVLQVTVSERTQNDFKYFKDFQPKVFFRKPSRSRRCVGEHWEH